MYNFYKLKGIIFKSYEKIQKELDEMRLCNTVICPAGIIKYQENNNFSLGKGWVVKRLCNHAESYNVYDKENSISEEHFETVCISTG